jgi:hypothetical protein
MTRCELLAHSHGMPAGSRCLSHFGHLRQEVIPRRAEPGKPLGMAQRLRESDADVQNSTEIKSSIAQDLHAIRDADAASGELQ